MVILIGNEERILKKLLAKKSYDELRELVAEMHPSTHVQWNPNKKPKEWLIKSDGKEVTWTSTVERKKE